MHATALETAGAISYAQNYPQVVLEIFTGRL